MKILFFQKKNANEREIWQRSRSLESRGGIDKKRKRVKPSWGHLGTYVALRFDIKGQIINKYGHAIKSETEMGSFGTYHVALRFNI